jgi:methyl-accepting chemotaxis protein
MQEQAHALSQAVAVFKLSGGMAETPVKRSNRPAAVAKLPNRGPATRKASQKIASRVVPVESRPKKVAAGGGDESWEEF